MKTLTLFISSGIIFISFFLCSCGNENPVVNSAGPNNTDTAFSSYVILTPAGGSADTLFFTDRNLCSGSYSSSQNNTYCLLNDTISNNSASVTFEGNSAGSPAFTFGYISYNGNGLNGTAISGIVTIYDAVGGKIKGTFSGTYTGSSITYQVNGEFTVKRTQ